MIKIFLDEDAKKKNGEVTFFIVVFP